MQCEENAFSLDFEQHVPIDLEKRLVYVLLIIYVIFVTEHEYWPSSSPLTSVPRLNLSRDLWTDNCYK